MTTQINKSKIVQITGSTGNIYDVDVENRTCTCPHYIHRLKGTREMCKHVYKGFRKFKKIQKEKVKVARLDAALSIQKNITGLATPENLVEVKGSTGNIYNVDVENQTCTCPHYIYRLQGTNEICKHIKSIKVEKSIEHSENCKCFCGDNTFCESKVSQVNKIPKLMNERLFELWSRAHNHTQGEPIDYTITPTIFDHLKAIHRMQKSKVPDSFQAAYLQYFKFK